MEKNITFNMTKPYIMKKIFVLMLLTFANILFAQKESKIDNGHCFTTLREEVVAEELLDIPFNKKVAVLLKQFDKEYTGHHLIKAKEYICSDNNTGQIKARIRQVEFACKRAEDSLCTIYQKVIIEKHLGGGNYGEPFINTMYNGGGGSGSYGCLVTGGYGQDIGALEKKWKSCACVEATRNWLDEAKKNGVEKKGSGSVVINNNITVNTQETTSKKETSSNPGTAVTTSAVKNISQLKPLDKTKQGYFVEKDDEVISMEGYKLNGKLHGEVREYSGGKVISVVTYNNDVQNGPFMNYDEKGQLKLTGSYKNGNPDGNWQHYENGVLKHTEKYVNGELQE
jgi:antitoxin component YwqK of YwqJK toxin-antitoxin module